VSPAKRILILAGPNGAGKTTFAREFLPGEAECQVFINADLIAAGLSPFKPELAARRAGRLMVEMSREHAARGESFAFETTLADRRHARWIRDWQAGDYHVAICFLALPTPEMAIERVAERVRQGGHHVPDDAVRRRFDAGKRNFSSLYQDLVDAWAIYDNSGRPPVLLDWSEKAMNPRPIEEAKDPLLARALPALIRARKRAEEIAAATNTAVVEMVAGKIVRVYPGRTHESKSR
jgi:predicted ABC-type ATPase